MPHGLWQRPGNWMGDGSCRAGIRLGGRNDGLGRLSSIFVPTTVWGVRFRFRTNYGCVAGVVLDWGRIRSSHDMGQTHVDIRIHGSFGSVVVSALADTAATFTKVPRSVFDEAGLVARYEAEVEIGDGRTIRRELALADVEIGGVRRPVLVSAGSDGERPLVGYTTLETLGFKVNTVAHRLEATPPIEYGGVPPS